MNIDSPMEMKWDPILKQTQIQEDPRGSKRSKAFQKKTGSNILFSGTMLYVKVMGKSMKAFPNLKKKVNETSAPSLLNWVGLPKRCFKVVTRTKSPIGLVKGKFHCSLTSAFNFTRESTISALQFPKVAAIHRTLERSTWWFLSFNPFQKDNKFI